MLNDLLKPEHLIRMKNLLEFENRADIQEKLVGNFNNVFGNIIWWIIILSSIHLKYPIISFLIK